MRFKARYTQADYKEGATRLKRCFAWLPVYIKLLGYWIFLENYEVLQVYHITMHTVIIDGKPEVFTNGRWVNIDKRCR